MKLNSDNLNKSAMLDKNQLSQVLETVFSENIYYMEDWVEEFGSIECYIYPFGNFCPDYDENDNIILPKSLVGFNDFIDIVNEDEWGLSVEIDYKWKEGFYDNGDYYTEPYVESSTITDYEIYRILFTKPGENIDITDELTDRCRKFIADTIMEDKGEDIVAYLDDETLY